MIDVTPTVYYGIIGLGWATTAGLLAALVKLAFVLVAALDRKMRRPKKKAAKR